MEAGQKGQECALKYVKSKEIDLHNAEILQPSCLESFLLPMVALLNRANHRMPLWLDI